MYSGGHHRKIVLSKADTIGKLSFIERVSSGQGLTFDSKKQFSFSLQCDQMAQPYITKAIRTLATVKQKDMSHKEQLPNYILSLDMYNQYVHKACYHKSPDLRFVHHWRCRLYFSIKLFLYYFENESYYVPGCLLISTEQNHKTKIITKF